MVFVTHAQVDEEKYLWLIVFCVSFEPLSNEHDRLRTSSVDV